MHNFLKATFFPFILSPFNQAKKIIMSLIINNNLLAVRSARNLNQHYSRLGQSTQRLSSGLRINSAADDASGLAIRELMRADIAAFQQGARNVSDAISMLQVADGALSVIDEKLIRMKELAEQAATGTYDSTQRLMIDSEFQAMAAEIDRIASATDFNGVKLLDGSLSGGHNGAGLASTGQMKIHFGSANDSAEDYYYVEIGDCGTRGLGLREAAGKAARKPGAAAPGQGVDPGANPAPPISIGLNDVSNTSSKDAAPGATLQGALIQGQWFVVGGTGHNGVDNFIVKIPRGTTNIVINANGHSLRLGAGAGDNDLQLFTASGVHLAGTPGDDYAWHVSSQGSSSANMLDLFDYYKEKQYIPFGSQDYDGSLLNSGPTAYDPDFKNLAFTTYNGMTIGYSGDSDRYDDQPNNGDAENWPEYELLTIDEATEDLYLMFPGAARGYLKAYWDLDDEVFGPPLKAEIAETSGGDQVIDIQTQDRAQKALERINSAIVKKDQIRAHLGALQNRFENTVTNINMQAENLQAAESRISDADVGAEMTQFVRNQILTQSAVAMLGQANSLPQMAMQIIGG